MLNSLTSASRTGPLVSRWRAFAKDRRGVAAAIFGLTMMGLIIFAGMTVDVARLEFVRERLISATDAAALAGARTINTSGTVYVTDADNFFNANFPTGYLGSTNPSLPTVTLSTDRTLLTVSETVTLPLLFGKLLGHTSPQAISYTSTALAGRIEVAMVIDNSGSMAQTVSGDSSSKIVTVQNAADAFAVSLTSLQNGNVRIAVVPFTMTVNLGITQSVASALSWIDPSASYMYPTSGTAPTNALTVTTTYPTGTAFSDVFTTSSGVNTKTNRFTLFTKFHSASTNNHLWDGCVEMRPPIYSADGSTRYDVLDTAPSTSLPGSLFVPLFWPAEAKTPVTGTTPNYSRLFYNHYLADVTSEDTTYASATSNYAFYTAQGDVTKYTSPSYVSGAGFLTAQATQSSIDNSLPNSFYPYGPNAGCEAYESTSSGAPGTTLATLTPLSRLTTTTATAEATINAMVPMGETYLPIGLFWGWELISPNSVFSDSQAAYSDPGITKAIILLTDGCNEIINGLDIYNSAQNACGNATTTDQYGLAFPNASDFTSVGYAWQYRIGPISANPNPTSDPTVAIMSDRQALADAELSTLCTNIKAKGVLIYAIGIDTQGSSNTALSSCATSATAPYYYSTPDPSDLTGVFEAIAASLTKVRLIAPAGSEPGI